MPGSTNDFWFRLALGPGGLDGMELFVIASQLVQVVQVAGSAPLLFHPLFFSSQSGSSPFIPRPLTQVSPSPTADQRIIAEGEQTKEPRPRHASYQLAIVDERKRTEYTWPGREGLGATLRIDIDMQMPGVDVGFVRCGPECKRPRGP